MIAKSRHEGGCKEVERIDYKVVKKPWRVSREKLWCDSRAYKQDSSQGELASTS